jgi:hypothetical protein
LYRDLENANVPTPPSVSNLPMRGYVRSVSRLLWPMYLFLVSWIVLPVYATIVAGLLPLGDADIDRLLALVIVLAGVVACWSGIRGGPLLMSEAQVLLGLSGKSGVPSRIAVMRQALFVAGFFGLGVAWLTAMAAAGSPDWGVSAQRTVVGFELGVSVVSLAVLWNVDGMPWLDRGFAVLVSALIATSALTGQSIESQLGPLGLLALVVFIMAVVRAPDIRFDRLWGRSLVLAELQYGAALLDFRSALAALRSSRDGPRVPRGRRGTRGLPVWLWRPLRSLRGSPSLVVVRLVAMVGGVALFLVVLQGTTARLAAIAAVLAIGAVDLTTPLASVVDRPLLTRSSRIPARLTLLSEATFGILLTVAAGVAGWAIVSQMPGELHAPAIAAVALAAGASSAVQARLGSPDLGAIITRFGPQRVQGVLATRAAGPIAALLLTVSGVAALTRQWNPSLAVILVVGWVVVLIVTTRPEKDL